MFEDITMEMKLSRTVQSPKGIAEIKKNQESVSKVHSKVPRKREKFAPKDEQFRNLSCSTAKGKQYNRKDEQFRNPSCSTSKGKKKKTSTRSSHYEIGGKVAELAGFDEDFDLKRSKKQNLAHLLIRCTPRESWSNTSYRSSSRPVFPHNSIRYLMSTQKHKYNKEQFLQANCQFIVRDDADYSIHMIEPDILVDWDRIEQIRVPSFEAGTCPICLEAPIAGKITRCGHIYCWPCIVHYSTLSDKTWYKCPICYEAIHMKDLKSVQIVCQAWFKKGQEITFQLMKREKGSTISIPVLEPSRIPNTLLSVSENSHTTVYSKLLLVNYENILKIIEDEENQLLNELKETEGMPERCFVELAMELLKKRKAELLTRNEGETSNQDTSNVCSAIEIPTSRVHESTLPGCSKNVVNTNSSLGDSSSDTLLHTDSNSSVVVPPDYEQISRKRYESVSSTDEIPFSITAEDLEIETPNANPSKYHFFYQAVDGQQIYLHSLNARMLERQYGSLEQSPHILVGNIVEIEIGTMTEELRKRLRYLDHLPITCQFQVVEIDLDEPLISNATRMVFKDQLEKRSRLRQQKAKEEKKLTKRAEMIAQKQYGGGFHSSPVRLHLDSLDHFPQCGAEEPAKVSHRNRSPSSGQSSPASSRRSVSPGTSAMAALTLNTNTFADKVKDMSKNGGWQRRAKANSESDASTGPHSQYLKDAVEAAFEQARLVKEGGEQNTGKNKKKKRKSKAIPLYSVGMAYNNS